MLLESRQPVGALLAMGLVALAAFVPSGAVRAQAVGTGVGTGAAATAPSSQHDVEVQAAIEAAVHRFEQGDAGGAADQLVAWLAARPELGDQRGFIAVAYSRELGNRSAFDEAITFLERFVAEEREWGEVSGLASLELGVLLSALLRFDEAIPHLEAVPRSRNMIGDTALLNLGRAYRSTGRFEEARAVYGSITAGGINVFAAAAECEIALAIDGPSAARVCLEQARGRHGDHLVFGQPAALLAYLEGDFDRAAEIVEDMYERGHPGARIDMLRPLLALAREGPGEALAVLERTDGVSVRGERDALNAVFYHQMAALDPSGELRAAAATSRRAAAERNPLFDVAERAGHVLFWRPEVIAAFQGADQPPSDEPAPSPATPEVEASSPTESGCCRAGGSRGARSTASVWLVLGAALLWARALRLT